MKQNTADNSNQLQSWGQTIRKEDMIFPLLRCELELFFFVYVCLST